MPITTTNTTEALVEDLARISKYCETAADGYQFVTAMTAGLCTLVDSLGAPGTEDADIVQANIEKLFVTLNRGELPNDTDVVDALTGVLDVATSNWCLPLRSAPGRPQTIIEARAHIESLAWMVAECDDLAVCKVEANLLAGLFRTSANPGCRAAAEPLTRAAHPDFELNIDTLRNVISEAHMCLDVATLS